MLHDLDAANDFALYSTQWLHRMLCLAAHIIIRITFSEVRTHVDLEHGERAFFKAIKFTRKRSVENNDLDSRAALILTQLWANNSSFRKKDGALIGDRMRLRSRLVSASVRRTLRTISENLMTSFRASCPTVTGTGGQPLAIGSLILTKPTMTKEERRPSRLMSSTRAVLIGPHRQCWCRLLSNHKVRQHRRSWAARCSILTLSTIFKTGIGPP